MGVLRPLMKFWVSSLFCVALFSAVLSAADSASFVGRDVCAACHKNIAATQGQTAMARTWQGIDTKSLPSVYREQASDGPGPAIVYLVHRDAHDFRYEVRLPGHSATSLKV